MSKFKNLYFDVGCNLLGGYEEMKKLIPIDDSWGKVFIEPNPEFNLFLKEKIKGIPNAAFVNKALWSHDGETTFITRSDAVRDSAGTIMDKDFFDKSVGQYGIDTNKYQTYQVNQITIEQILDIYELQNLYIKMDCEGAEFEILSNFPEKYISKIRKLYVEFHAHTKVMRSYRDKLIKDFKNKGITIELWH